jgi:hypothetical protein
MTVRRLCGSRGTVVRPVQYPPSASAAVGLRQWVAQPPNAELHGVGTIHGGKQSMQCDSNILSVLDRSGASSTPTASFLCAQRRRDRRRAD